MPIHTANALIVYKGSILLLLRDNNSEIPEPNKWSLIGGEIESGESAKKAILREAEEEISIRPSYCKYLGLVHAPDKKSHSLFFIRLTKTEAENIKLGNEGQRIEFFSPKDIEKIRLTKNLNWYFKKYKPYLSEVIRDEIFPSAQKLGLEKR